VYLVNADLAIRRSYKLHNHLERPENFRYHNRVFIQVLPQGLQEDYEDNHIAEEGISRE